MGRQVPDHGGKSWYLAGVADHLLAPRSPDVDAKTVPDRAVGLGGRRHHLANASSADDAPVRQRAAPAEQITRCRYQPAGGVRDSRTDELDVADLATSGGVARYTSRQQRGCVGVAGVSQAEPLQELPIER